MSVYNKTDLDALSCHMSKFQESFVEDHKSTSVNKLWLDLNSALQEGIDKLSLRKIPAESHLFHGEPRTHGETLEKETASSKSIRIKRTLKDRKIFSK